MNTLLEGKNQTTCIPMLTQNNKNSVIGATALPSLSTSCVWNETRERKFKLCKWIMINVVLRSINAILNYIKL